MTIDNPVVETNYGPVRGTDDGRVRAWKGIRYAAAPSATCIPAPEPPERWTEVADATTFGPAYPNRPFRTSRSTWARRKRRLPATEHLGIVGHRAR